MNLILLGAPGAGKGTQAEILCAKLNIPSISTGNILRAAVKDGTEMGLKAKSFMDAGALVPDEVIVERMGGRRVCEKCGASYHIINKKSKVEGVCDCCGGKLVTRKDDEPATVLDRLKAYHEQTEPLVAFYKERNKLAVIPFSPSIEATTAEVMKALEA